MKWLVGPAALVATLALASACTTDYNATVFIKFNQPFNTGCEIGDGSGHVFVSSGTLDVTQDLGGAAVINPGYLLGPAMQNVAQPTAVAPQAHKFFIEKADVELLSNGSAQSNALVAELAKAGLDKRTQNTSGIVEPGSTAGLFFSVIDEEQTTYISQHILQPTQLLTRSRVSGKIDGSSVQSDPFVYPVTVCLGCLLNDVGPCANITKDDPRMFRSGGSCNVFQDGVLDCCSFTGGVQCPPIKPTM